MALSEKMAETLQELLDSGTTEGRAVAECLREIASNEHDDPDLDMSSDDFLVICAQEIRDWANVVVKAFKGEGRMYKIIRFHSDGEKEVLTTGLTLEEAQARTRDPNTRKAGEWFDGYVEE